MTAVLLKSTVALLLALSLVLAARRSRASLRHLILAAMFVFLLLLPLVQRFAPAVDIPLQAAPVAFVAPVATPAPLVAENAPALQPQRSIDPLSILTTIYLVGAGLLLSHLLVGMLRLRWLANDAEVWLEGTARMNEVANGANIRRPALVVLSGDVAVPLTFGFVRSTIVLPDDARDWPADELTRALRHELEHVRRDDWMLQLAARAAVAFYWPQPLVWIAWRRFCLEAERACDDAVLGTAEPSEYAGQLVSLARNLNRIGSVPVLAMASRSKLSTRVEAILDATQSRGPYSRYAALAVSLALIALLGSIAPARLIAATAEAPRQVREVSEPLSSRFGEALVKSAEAGDVQDVRVLIDAGVDIDTVAPGDGTALIGAARGGQTHMVNFLLDRGADPNLACPGDGNPLIAASAQGYVEIASLLLERGARIDDMIRGDENALMQAVINGHEDVVRMLIARGADVRSRSVEGTRVRTPLSLSREYGHSEIEALLVAAGARQ
jgi:beta-lactamase regulating signal transducer with metallopeptidase domain